MAVDEDLEAPVFGPQVNGLRDYASVAVDLMHVAQVLRLRDDMAPGTDAVQVFTRRALWESAVVADGRCFSRGGRQVNVRDLVKTLADPLRDCHEQIIDLRNGEIAHSDKARTERVSAHAVLDPQDGGVRGIRLRVFPTMGPIGITHDDDTFVALVAQMRALVEERKMAPLAQQISAGQDRAQLSKLAAPFVSKSARAFSSPAVRVTIDLPA